MIYSASRRTDMIAFYPDELCRRVSRSRKLEALVLWTKDPRNILSHLGLRTILANYPVIVQFTLTGLGSSWWEPGVPAPAELMPALRELAGCLPAGAIRWRFDPLLLVPHRPLLRISECSMERALPLPAFADDPQAAEQASSHPDDGFRPALQEVRTRFLAMRDLLRACGLHPEEAVVSFPNAYPRVRQRLEAQQAALPTLTALQKATVLRELIVAGGLPLALCCEPKFLNLPGVRQSHCIDGALFDRLYGTHLASLPRDTGQRLYCGCSRSTDIGSYEMACAHNCRYCYARPVL